MLGAERTSAFGVFQWPDSDMVVGQRDGRGGPSYTVRSHRVDCGMVISQMGVEGRPAFARFPGQPACLLLFQSCGGKKNGMNTSISDIETGMDVYGIGGEKIGSVAQVWPNAGNTRGIMGVTPGANEFGSGSLTTPEYQESRILEQVEGRGTRAGDIGTSTSSATSFGPDEPGHAPGKGPATVSSQEIGDEGYFVVDKGGILGIGVSHLYVPAKAVNDVAAGRVTLGVTKEQADRLYSQKPGFLQ